MLDFLINGETDMKIIVYHEGSKGSDTLIGEAKYSLEAIKKSQIKEQAAEVYYKGKLAATI